LGRFHPLARFMFGPFRTAIYVFMLGFGIYLGVKFEQSRTGPVVDRICNSPNISVSLSATETQILCR
jgi:hypothetical protein